MTMTFVLLALALIAGVAASWERLFASEPRKRWAARVSICCLVGTLGLNGFLSLREWQATETMREFFELQEPTVDEASGGSFAAGRAFVVDDESRGVFVYAPSGSGQPLEFRSFLKLKEGHLHKAFVSEVNGKTVNVEKADDLEGAASFDGKLYVVTSHSRNKKSEEKPERRLFLELEVNGESAIVSRSTDLKPRIHSFLRAQADEIGASLSSPIESIEIEGLAIDPVSQRALFGLRKPTLNLGEERYAIVLGIPLRQIFTETATLELFALRLRSKTGPYGIVSLEYDPESQGILVLGGSTEKEDFSHPANLWRWKLGTKSIFQKPKEVASQFVHLPDKMRAKLEAVVVVSGEDQVVIFVDSDGYGGQRGFDRQTLGISQVAERPAL